MAGDDGGSGNWAVWGEGGVGDGDLFFAELGKVPGNVEYSRMESQANLIARARKVVEIVRDLDIVRNTKGTPGFDLKRDVTFCTRILLKYFYSLETRNSTIEICIEGSDGPDHIKKASNIDKKFTSYGYINRALIC